MGDGHGASALALSGDVEVVQDVPYFRDAATLVGALKQATLTSFNHMRRRGDDPVAIAYLKEIRALVALEMDIQDRRGGRDDDALSSTRDKVAQELREHRTAVDEEKTYAAIKAKLQARLADLKAQALDIALMPASDALAPKRTRRAARTIEPSQASTPLVISPENDPSASPVRTRTRNFPEKN